MSDESEHVKEELAKLEITPSVNEEPKAQKKKKKKKNKKKTTDSEQATTTVPADANNEGESTSIQPTQELAPRIEPSAIEGLESVLKKISKTEKHNFWDTQPVPKLIEDPEAINTYIEPPRDDIQKEPYPLLSAFEWYEPDVDNPKEIEEIYTLLNKNYVEDDDNMFRFDYSIPFLQWALKPPGYRRDWHLAVRVKANGNLVAFITAIPATIKIYDKELKQVEINFLCVHKKLRSKRLAPVLIKEITRRVNLTGIFQAVYTAGVVLPKPIASCRYYHRSLNPKKLIEVGFSHLAPRMTIARTVKLFKLEDNPLTPGIRETQPKDVPAVTVLLKNYLAKYGIRPIFTEEEVAHWFLPREGIVNSFVVENPTSKQITDFISFYTLPSSILGNKHYQTLKAAYSFYNVAHSTPLVQLMRDALIFAKQRDFDVYNALDIFENIEFMKPLKFGIGDGHLQYYLYNWKCPPMEPKNVGLVLL